jgi:DNA-binding beta-propeller fold protein YncE
MACIEQKTDFNFLNWNKVVGSYTLSQLQASGVPSVCDNITPEPQGWNISTAAFLASFSVAAEDTIPADVFMKPDGSKAYLVGSNNRSVYEYDVTNWNITTAVINQNYNPSQPISAIYFKPDGLKMYLLASPNIREYDLSTAWDVSTSVFNQKYNAVAQGQQSSIFFRSDGLKMYTSSTTSETIEEYTLSRAWDVSSLSPTHSFSVTTWETSAFTVFFKTNGERMYVLGFTGSILYEFNLSIAWDVRTAVISQNFDASAQDTSPIGFFIRDDGLKMYLTGSANDSIYEYDLTD